jgi:hypothetical protein
VKTRGGYGPSNLMIAPLQAAAAPTRGTVPPQWVRDLAAERAMTGGFRTSRKHQCPRCFQQRSANGSCACA